MFILCLKIIIKKKEDQINLIINIYIYIKITEKEEENYL